MPHSEKSPAEAIRPRETEKLDQLEWPRVGRMQYSRDMKNPVESGK
jgi:hypothetical protein